MHKIWRLSEAGPRNLGLACTDDGVFLGHTPLIDRRDGRFVAPWARRNRLLKCVYDGEPPIDWLMSGLARARCWRPTRSAARWPEGICQQDLIQAIIRRRLLLNTRASRVGGLSRAALCLGSSTSQMDIGESQITGQKIGADGRVSPGAIDRMISILQQAAGSEAKA